jgi:hypothetical protein
VDNEGNAYLTGYTGGASGAFVAKINAPGSAVAYSTVLGTGTGQSIAVNSAGNAYVTWGETVTALNAAGTSRLYSIDFGNSSANAVAVDSSGSAYVAGWTNSINFPSVNPLQPIYGGGYSDAFVAKIAFLGPAADLSASSLSFGSQPVDSTSAARKVTLTNAGETNLNISSITAGGDFALFTTATSCTYTGGMVTPRTHCTIDVTFTPTATGSRTGTITVVDDATGSPQIISLTGTGVPAATLMPTGLSFGSVAMGTSSAGKTITLINNQSISLTDISVGITGSNDYSQTNPCGSSIGAKQKCTITITFTPSIIGVDNATLSISDSAANSPQIAALTGTGTTPVTLTPTRATYSSQTVGTTSAAKAFTLTSNLNATLNNVAISTSGDFAVSSTTCTTTLASKGKCTVNVVFKPTAKGTRTGTLSVSDSAGNSPQTAALTGTGK